MSSDTASRVGKVLSVDGVAVEIEIDSEVPDGLIFIEGEPHSIGQVGSFVRFPMGFTNLVGIITKAGATAASALAEEPAGHVAQRWMTAQLVGESSASTPFVRGVARLPAVGAPVHVVTRSDLKALYGGQEDFAGWFTVGQVAAAESIDARLDANKLVTRHCAVVGSTGSGKSTTVARIIESLTDPTRFASSRVILFDLHGEYGKTFAKRGTLRNVTLSSTSSSLFVPYWALSFEELIPLTFDSLADEAGRSYVRDEIVRLKREALAAKPIPGISEDDLTVDTPVPFSVHQLWFDLHCYVNATHSVPGTAQTTATWALELDPAGAPIDEGDAAAVRPPRFQPQEQAAGAPKVFLSAAPLTIRRNVDILASRLRDRRWSFILDPGPWAPDVNGIAKEDLDTLLDAWLNPDVGPLVVDLSGAPPAIVSEVIGSMTRLVYDALFWARKFSEGGRERPVLLVFEEAHVYLSGTAPTGARSSVQRIVREGRKYGVGAMIVSQRPSEIDATVLSQCGSMIAMRLTNPSDRQIVARSAADSLDGMFALLPILRTGEALMVGEFVNFPTRVRFFPPTSKPDSLDPIVVGESERPGGWDKERQGENYSEVAAAWRRQSIDSPHTKV